MLEWAFTILFTIEYILRASLNKKPLRFIFSFLGIVDLLAILPTYFTLLLPGSQPLLVLRAVRLLRIFRIFRLSHFLTDLRFLSSALASGFRKISIFFMFAMVIVIIMASIMYLVEKPEDGFTSIPQCIYWAITTITTVGYGDLIPATPLGKIIANLLMIIGFATIAVPTGIITTEMALAIKSRETKHDVCKSCNKKGHDHDAAFCKHCGSKFEID
ncbi:MAG: ion transporter [Chitinophagaceae bacterium]